MKIALLFCVTASAMALPPTTPCSAHAYDQKYKTLESIDADIAPMKVEASTLKTDMQAQMTSLNSLLNSGQTGQMVHIDMTFQRWLIVTMNLKSIQPCRDYMVSKGMK